MRRAASADRGVRTRPARATHDPGGRQSRGHPMLPDRASPTSWRGRCTPPQTARRFDHSPGTWALPMGVGATSVTPGRGSCGLARAPLGSDPWESQGSAAVSVCGHPAGGRAARGPCSPILSPDPLFASSVPTPANAPRRFVLGAGGAAVPARHGLLPRPHEHRSVAHDRQVQHPAAGDRPRSQRAVGTRCAACRR
jgi:hypothetical protein